MGRRFMAKGEFYDQFARYLVTILYLKFMLNSRVGKQFKLKFKSLLINFQRYITLITLFITPFVIINISLSITKCSSGCGTGYSTRNVTCTNGHIENPSECTEPRPIKYKQCENKNHCRWRFGKWKNCTCAGYQKRRITCWDGYKNTAANNCPDDDKPSSRQRCSAPPNCNAIF